MTQGRLICLAVGLCTWLAVLGGIVACGEEVDVPGILVLTTEQGIVSIRLRGETETKISTSVSGESAFWITDEDGDGTATMELIYMNEAIAPFQIPSVFLGMPSEASFAVESIPLLEQSLYESAGQFDTESGKFDATMRFTISGLPFASGPDLDFPTDDTGFDLFLQFRGRLDPSRESIQISGVGVIESGFLEGTEIIFLKSCRHSRQIPCVEVGKSIRRTFTMSEATDVGECTVDPKEKANCRWQAVGMHSWQIVVDCKEEGLFEVRLPVKRGDGTWTEKIWLFNGSKKCSD